MKKITNSPISIIVLVLAVLLAVIAVALPFVVGHTMEDSDDADMVLVSHADNGIVIRNYRCVILKGDTLSETTKNLTHNDYYKNEPEQEFISLTNTDEGIQNLRFRIKFENGELMLDIDDANFKYWDWNIEDVKDVLSTHAKAIKEALVLVDGKYQESEWLYCHVSVFPIGYVSIEINGSNSDGTEDSNGKRYLGETFWHEGKLIGSSDSYGFDEWDSYVRRNLYENYDA